MTCVRAMVFNTLYRGRITYGKTRWTDKGDTKVKVRVPESQWLTVEAPALRIVSDELWKAAHTRIGRTRQAYLRQTGGKLNGRPETGIESHNLMSGFLQCGACGGAMHAVKRTSRRGGPKVYFLCNGWRVNGSCDNAMSAHQIDIDRAVLEMFRHDVLSPDIIETVIRRAVQIYREEPDVYAERRERFASEALRLQAEIARLTEAIASGGQLAPLLDALKQREGRRADVLAQLEHLDGMAKAPTWGDRLSDEIRARIEEWHSLIGRQPIVARQIVRKLLIGRLTLTPRQDGTRRWYDITGQASYGTLLAGVVGFVPPG